MCQTRSPPPLTATPGAPLLDTLSLTQPPPPSSLLTVLSAAPLLGAAASPDPRQPAWLHVEVRPPARGLLRAAKAGGSRATGGGLAAALVDGKWVLAFPDGAAAAAAGAALGSAEEEARAGLRVALADLLGMGGGCEGGAAAGDA